MNIKQLILESYELLDAHFAAAKAGIPLPDRPDITQFAEHWGYHTGPDSHVAHNIRDQAIYHYKNGKVHRDDGPAIEHSDGAKLWYKNGKMHRDDGPAVQNENGDKFWYQHDKRHRDNGPAVEYSNGDKHWYKHGERHRDDGPAIDHVDGRTEWYTNGEQIPVNIHDI